MEEQKEISIKEILENAPMDDEEVTIDDLLSIIVGELQIANGDCVRLEDLEF